MDLRGVAPILQQFESEITKLEVLDKLLDYGREVSQYSQQVSAAPIAIAPPPKAGGHSTSRKGGSFKEKLASVPPQEKGPSAIMKSVVNNAKAYAHSFTNIRDAATREILQTFGMVEALQCKDKGARQAANDALADIKVMGTHSLEIIAKLCARELWSDKFKVVQDVVIEKLGYVRCIELDLEGTGYSSEVWERHALRPLAKQHNLEFLDYEKAIEAFTIQWKYTHLQVKRAYGSDTFSDWTKPLWQLDVRVLDVLIFNSSLRSKFEKNSKFMKMYKENYTYVKKPSKEEIQFSRHLKKLSVKEEKAKINQEVEEIFALDYIPKGRLMSYGNLHEAKTRPLWELRKNEVFLSDIVEPNIAPYMAFRQALANTVANEVESKK